MHEKHASCYALTVVNDEYYIGMYVVPIVKLFHFSLGLCMAFFSFIEIRTKHSSNSLLSLVRLFMKKTLKRIPVLKKTF